jgi:hypothetical protein
VPQPIYGTQVIHLLFIKKIIVRPLLRKSRTRARPAPYAAIFAEAA